MMFNASGKNSKAIDWPAGVDTLYVRALLKTLKMTSEPALVQLMRGTIDAIWPIFDDDGSGTIEYSELNALLRAGAAASS